jgi:hypothetical protein
LLSSSLFIQLLPSGSGFRILISGTGFQAFNFRLSDHRMIRNNFRCQEYQQF